MHRIQTQLGDDWDLNLPESLRARWVRALVDLRVARLLAYRAVSLQDDPSAGAAASAARPASPLTTPATSRSPSCCSTCWVRTALDSVHATAALHGAVEDHWRYAQAATVASGTIEVQRMPPVARDTLGETPVKTTLPQDITDFAAVATKRFARLGMARRPHCEPRPDDSVQPGGPRRPGRARCARARCPLLGPMTCWPPRCSSPSRRAPPCCPIPSSRSSLAIDGARLALVNPEAPRIDHGDLDGDWIAADPPGRHPLPPGPGVADERHTGGPSWCRPPYAHPMGRSWPPTLIFISCWDHGGFWEQCSSRCTS